MIDTVVDSRSPAPAWTSCVNILQAEDLSRALRLGHLALRSLTTEVVRSSLKNGAFELDPFGGLPRFSLFVALFRVRSASPERRSRAQARSTRKGLDGFARSTARPGRWGFDWSGPKGPIEAFEVGDRVKTLDGLD